MALHNLASLLDGQGKIGRSHGPVSEGLKLNPRLTEGYYNLGNVWREQGNFDEAVSCYKKVLQLDPNHAQAANNLGTVLVSQGRLEMKLSTTIERPWRPSPALLRPI